MCPDILCTSVPLLSHFTKGANFVLTLASTYLRQDLYTAVLTREHWSTTQFRHHVLRQTVGSLLIAVGSEDGEKAKAEMQILCFITQCIVTMTWQMHLSLAYKRKSTQQPFFQPRNSFPVMAEQPYIHTYIFLLYTPYMKSIKDRPSAPSCLLW